MQKILLTITLLSLNFLLIACPLATVPTMERPIKVWNGAPEENGICRMNSVEVSQQLKIPYKITKKVVQDPSGVECISADEEVFKTYACLTFDDLRVLHDYQEKLIHQCKKWK